MKVKISHIVLFFVLSSSASLAKKWPVTTFTTGSENIVITSGKSDEPVKRSLILMDTENPILTSDPFSPATGSLNVAHTTNFEIEFNEPVSGAGTGNVRLRAFTDDALVALLDGATLFTNSIATTLSFVSLETFIADSTKYYFEFEPGAVLDTAGNAFAGLGGADTWNFTSAGPARIDAFSAACVGEVFTIEGAFMSGVTSIELGEGADITTYNSADLTIEGDTLINFIIVPSTFSGRIKLIKAAGEGGNVETFETLSSEEVTIGISSADLDVVADANVCNDSNAGVPNQAKIVVNIFGGSGIFDMTINNGVTDTLIMNYTTGDTLLLTPPQFGTNVFELIAVTDNDAALAPCVATDLGTPGEAEKFERAIVEAGGTSTDPVTGFGTVSICVAELDRVDLSDASVIGTLPDISTPNIGGDPETGRWRIVNQSASGSGGFNPGRTMKETSIINPTYYPGFDDIAQGSVTLELSSDDPGAPNPCSTNSDRLIISFTGNSRAQLVSSDLDVCQTEEGGEIIAITQVEASLEGGATSLEWSRTTNAENITHDGSWGFADSESAANFTLTTATLNPFYKASPNELNNNFAQIQVVATNGNCGSLSDASSLDLNIITLPAPNKSTGAGINPEQVCSGEAGITFSLNPSSGDSQFSWSLTNSGPDTPGSNDRNEITTAPVSGFYGATIAVDFKEVNADTPETLTVFEINNGCFSQTLVFDIIIKAPIIAQIIEGPASTINNNTTDLELLGQGGTVGNLMPGGTFSGLGVLETSDGRFLLNTTGLTPTDPNNPADDYIINYTYTSTDGLSCTATASTRFDVFDQQNSFLGLDLNYCESDDTFIITLDNSVLSSNTIVTDIYVDNSSAIEGVTFVPPVSTTYQAVFDPDLVLQENGNRSNVSVKYATENLVTGETNSLAGSQSVTIFASPQVAPNPINASYCAIDESIFLNRNEAINPNNSFTFSILNNLPGGLDLLKTTTSPRSFELDFSVMDDYLTANDLDSIDLEILYEYTSDQGCINFDTLNTIIFKIPEQPQIQGNRTQFSFERANNQIVATDTVVISDSLNALEVYWFTSEDNIIRGQQIHIGNSFTPTIGLNEQVADFFAVRFDNFCESYITEVEYFRIEKPVLDWNKSVFSASAPIVFTADDRNEDNLFAIEDREWSITDANGVTLTLPLGAVNGTALTYDFEQAGQYTVSYRIETDKQSSITTTEKMIAVPARTDLFYDFNEGDNNWVAVGASGSESTWQRAIPASGFQNENTLWVTNPSGDYNAEENSFLYSPAFDISEVEKPVISFDLWLDLNDDDGLILEYATDGLRIEDENKNWETLGTLNTGLSWYNSNELEIADLGFNIAWSSNFGEINTPSNARQLLDAVLNSRNNGEEVIFRFQLNSESITTGNGAAIDNFAVESRNRNLLIEYFGNNNAIDAAQMSVLNASAEVDFSWINYRTNQDDPLYGEAESDVATRTFFYDAFENNNDFAIDGQYQSGAFLSDNLGELEKQALVSSIFDLTVSASANEANSALNISANVQLIDDNPLPENTRLMIAVINDSINTEGQLYHNVLQDFLPSAQGTLLNELGSYEFEYVPTSSAATKDLTVVAFLQQFTNEDLNVVYQSASTMQPITLTNAVTGIDDEFLNSLSPFPNPAKNQLTINFNGIRQNLMLQVFDVQGRLVHKDFINSPTSTFLLSTSAIANGLYSLLISDKSGNTRQLKFAVKH